MRKTIIDNLCEAINAHNNLTYPMKGYMYFADIRGDGRNIRRVYAILKDEGGVVACHNGPSYRHTANNLRKLLEKTA